MDIGEDRILVIGKNIVLYWIKEVLEKGFYIIAIVIITFIILGIRNPYGRYLDAWLE